MIWDTAYKIVSKFYKAVNKTIRIIITTVVILLIVSGITAGTGWLLLHNLYEQSREEEYKILSNLNEGTFRRMRNTEIYDKNGNKIGEIKAADFQYTKLKDICSLIQEGYIAVEDVRFKEHNGIDVDPDSIFDVQVKRLHEYKRQQMNALYIIHKYLEIKGGKKPSTPVTFIFGAKAAAGYRRAKLTIKLINNVANVINNDKSIDGKIKVVFIENYRVSNAEIIFAAADVSEQISTASKEASGTGNMKFMLNGAMTLGTMDGANVEIVKEVGEENAVIFGLTAEEVIKYQNEGGYNPQDIFNNDQEIRQVLMQLINGFYSPEDPELFRDIYNSLLYDAKPDVYFILKDFRSYADAQKKIEEKYRDSEGWARSVMLNTACSGKFSSDRTIEEYVRDIWHLDKVKVEL